MKSKKSYPSWESRKAKLPVDKYNNQDIKGLFKKLKNYDPEYPQEMQKNRRNWFVRFISWLFRGK